VAASESYPDELRYHPEHDWARIENGEATLGITWFAQDALGELVHFEAPDEGATVTKDQSYGEVESVKAVSDVIAPLSGEIVAVNPKVVAEPETVNDDACQRKLLTVRPTSTRRPRRRSLCQSAQRGLRQAGRPVERGRGGLAERGVDLRVRADGGARPRFRPVAAHDRPGAAAGRSGGRAAS